MSDQVISAALAFAKLPALKQPLEGGKFCGVFTKPDGTHCAVVRLDAESPKRLDYAGAIKWAQSVGGEAPSRAVAAVMYANARDLFKPTWYWTSETEGESSAWICDFDGGYQDYYDRDAEGSAVAVRLIPLVA